MDIGGKDFVYIALGAGALFLILKNAKPLSEIVSGASSVVTPLLEAAGKGAAIVTNPDSYQTYTGGLLAAPFSLSQAWRLFKQSPGIPELINLYYREQDPRFWV